MVTIRITHNNYRKPLSKYSISCKQYTVTGSWNCILHASSFKWWAGLETLHFVVQLCPPSLSSLSLLPTSISSLSHSLQDEEFLYHMVLRWRHLVAHGRSLSWLKHCTTPLSVSSRHTLSTWTDITDLFCNKSVLVIHNVYIVSIGYKKHFEMTSMHVH